MKIPTGLCICECWEGNHDKHGCFYLRTKDKFNEHNCKKFRRFYIIKK